MPVCEIKLEFDNEAELITIRDTNLIGKIPVLMRAIEGVSYNWENEDVVVADPLHIPFEKEAGDFLFEHLGKYKFPKFNELKKKVTVIKPFTDKGNNEEEKVVMIDHFPEANEKNLEELKVIIELANFFECTEFVDCIGYVIASKLNEMNIQDVADYIGAKIESSGRVFDEDDKWLHPPIPVFSTENSYEIGEEGEE